MIVMSPLKYLAPLLLEGLELVGTLKIPSANTLAIGRDIFPEPRLLKASSSMVLNTAFGLFKPHPTGLRQSIQSFFKHLQGW